MSKKVLNWSMGQYKRRFIITINTPPETEPDLVMDLMKDAVSRLEGVLADPAPRAYFKGIKDQSLEFDLFYWVSKDILVAQSEANLAVQRSLREAGIKILLPRKLEIQEPVEDDKD